MIVRFTASNFVKWSSSVCQEQTEQIFSERLVNLDKQTVFQYNFGRSMWTGRGRMNRPKTIVNCRIFNIKCGYQLEKAILKVATFAR